MLAVQERRLPGGPPPGASFPAQRKRFFASLRMTRMNTQNDRKEIPGQAGDDGVIVGCSRSQLSLPCAAPRWLSCLPRILGSSARPRSPWNHSPWVLQHSRCASGCRTTSRCRDLRQSIPCGAGGRAGAWRLRWRGCWQRRCRRLRLRPMETKSLSIGRTSSSNKWEGMGNWSWKISAL